MALLSMYLQRKRLEKVEPFIRGDVLDLGCHEAAGWRLGGDRITNYYGVDYSADVVERLATEIPAGHFFCRDLDEDELDFDIKFDCVLMTALIEHLYNQKHIMTQVRNQLKPGGVALLTTPTPFGNDVVHKLGAKVGLFASAAMEDHIVIYNKHRFEIMAADIGFSIRSYERFQLGCNQMVVLEAL